GEARTPRPSVRRWTGPGSRPVSARRSLPRSSRVLHAWCSWIVSCVSWRKAGRSSRRAATLVAANAEEGLLVHDLAAQVGAEDEVHVPALAVAAILRSAAAPTTARWRRRAGRKRAAAFAAFADETKRTDGEIHADILAGAERRDAKPPGLMQRVD